MTTTEDLIARLTADTRSVPRHAAALRIGVALAVGGLASLLALALTLGNPFFGTALVGVTDYGLKLAFTAALVLATSHLLVRAACPGKWNTGALGWLATPVVLMSIIAALGIDRADEGQRIAYIMGSTWATCLPSVLTFSLPVFASLLLAFRRLAPTDLRRAGTLAGLSAGAVSAAVYALHCPETSPAFVLIWYGLGIAGAGIIGRLLGPVLLRW